MFTTASVTALDAAYAQGAKEVQFEGRRYVFHSVDDYIKLRNVMLNDIAANGGQKQVRQVRIATESGFGH